MRAAAEMRELLMREGAYVHECVKASAMTSMGGGMGMCATAALPPATRLVRMPAHTMLTTRQARLNLSLIECAARQCSAHTTDEACATPCVLSLTAHDTDAHATARALDMTRAARVRAVAAELQQRLDATETMVCYLLVLAAMHGRWQQQQQHHRDDDSDSDSVDGVDEGDARVVCFTHESAWLPTWLRALPAQCDNLLELALDATTSVQRDDDAVRGDALAASLYFARHRLKALAELAEVRARYERCVSTLRCLACLPRASPRRACVHCAAHADATAAVAHRHAVFCSVDRSGSRTHASEQVRSASDRLCAHTSCALPQFVWAFNTVMSRGFAFDDEVWALMPYVDYFNYALDANCTMYVQRTPSARPTCAGDGASRRGACATPSARHDDDDDGGGRYAYVFETCAPVRCGEQLCLPYGAYSDYELLLWYGFTLRPSLLPLSLSSSSTNNACDDDDAALAALLRVLVGGDDDARRALYAQQQRSNNGSTAAPQHGDGDDDSVAYETWCVALQRCFSYEFAALASADGTYATTLSRVCDDDDDGVAAAATSWLDELLLRYTTRVACVSSLSSHRTTAVVADDMRARAAAEALVAWWPHVAAVVHARCNADADRRTHCFLGCLGMSRNMRAWVRALAGATQRSDARRAAAPASAALPSSPSSPSRLAAMHAHELVRALAWLELRVNDLVVDDGDARARSAMTTSRTAAQVMAVRMSRDAQALLRHLALHATDAALRDYVAYKSTH